MITPTFTYQRALNWLLGVTLATSAFFAAFPRVDIAVSRWFYHGGFLLNEDPFLLAVRQGLIWFMYAFSVAVAAAFLYRLVKKQNWRKTGFALAVILTGPIFLVNVVLKANWGRARPANITEFGGELAFTPAWFMSDQCHYNCSFTSGEGGAIATTALLIGFLAWHKAAKHRLWLVSGLILLVLVGAGLRVAMGRHFLSDTLLSMELCALVAMFFYPLFFKTKTEEVSIPYTIARVRHPAINTPIELFVPTAASHRPAVKAFLRGKYHEGVSHRSFKRLLKHRGGNVVHAGAFFGDMLHTLSRFADTVYAFEPVLENYVLAKKNLSHLGLGNVVLQNLALGAERGFADLQTHTPEGVFRGGGSSVARGQPEDPGLCQLVPVIPLDSMGLTNVSVLHLDVEGFEAEVITGAKALIAASKPVIMLEDNPQKCAAILEPMGYQRAFRMGSLDYWALPDDLEFVMGLKP